MKRGTPEHFKTIRLATLLHCDRCEALGIVEALCNHFAPRSCPQGNVGRCTDDEIASGCYSSRDGAQLVQALVDSGWLDASEQHRLVIHDWPDHADEAVRKWLIRNKLQWAIASGFRRVGVRMASRRHLDGVRPPRAGNGNGNGLDLLPDPEGKVRKGRGRHTRSIEVDMPNPFSLDEELRDFAQQGGFDPPLVFAEFKDKVRAKGWRYVDWRMGFKSYLRMEKKFELQRRRG